MWNINRPVQKSSLTAVLVKYIANIQMNIERKWKVSYWLILGHFYYKHGQTELIHGMGVVKESIVPES